jgi:hypothetical protein
VKRALLSWGGRGWLLALLLLGAAVGPARCQTGGQGLSLGLESRLLQQSDDLVSPLRYSGTTWGPTLGYGFSSPVQIRGFALSMGLPVLTSSETEKGAHRQEGYRLDLSVGLFHQVVGSEVSTFSLYLGGELRGEAAFFDHWYTSVDRESSMHLFFLLQPGGVWRVQLPWGDELSQRITVPLGGLVMRPDYQGMTEAPDVEWAGVGRVTGVHQSLQLLRPLGSQGRWGVSYEFTAFRYPDPRPMAMVRHALRVQATVWRRGK